MRIGESLTQIEQTWQVDSVTGKMVEMLDNHGHSLDGPMRAGLLRRSEAMFRELRVTTIALTALAFIAAVITTTLSIAAAPVTGGLSLIALLPAAALWTVGVDLVSITSAADTVVMTSSCAAHEFEIMGRTPRRLTLREHWSDQMQNATEKIRKTLLLSGVLHMQAPRSRSAILNFLIDSQ